MIEKTAQGRRGKLLLWFTIVIFVILSTGWGLMSIVARSSETSGPASLPVADPVAMNSSQNIVSVEISSWQQAAELARTHVRNIQIDGRPLVRVAARYNVDQRLIHDEQLRGTTFPVQLAEDEWRQRLNPLQFRIIRQSGTERAFTSKLDTTYESGIYYSRATGQPLFSSEDKYDSGTGWPSFTKPITPEALAYFYEQSFFSRNIEVVDSLSGAHLGHVFNDGPGPTRQRYCINGEALIFVPEGGVPPKLLLPES